MAEQKQDDQLEYTYSSYGRIQDIVLKTGRRRWTIGRSGERGSGISVQAAQHDDDDDEYYSRSALENIHLTSLVPIIAMILSSALFVYSLCDGELGISVKILIVWVEMLFYKILIDWLILMACQPV